MCTTWAQRERAFHTVNAEMQAGGGCNKYRMNPKTTCKSHMLLGEVSSKRVSQSGKGRKS